MNVRLTVMLDSHLKKMIVLDILHSFSIFALWLHLLEEKTTRQADQSSLPAQWGVVIYLFYGYFHPIPESEHHLAIKPNRHIFHHNPPQLFIKLR